MSLSQTVNTANGVLPPVIENNQSQVGTFTVREPANDEHFDKKDPVIIRPVGTEVEHPAEKKLKVMLEELDRLKKETSEIQEQMIKISSENNKKDNDLVEMSKELSDLTNKLKAKTDENEQLKQELNQAVSKIEELAHKDVRITPFAFSPARLVHPTSPEEVTKDEVDTLHSLPTTAPQDVKSEITSDTTELTPSSTEIVTTESVQPDTNTDTKEEVIIPETQIQSALSELSETDHLEINDSPKSELSDKEISTPEQPEQAITEEATSETAKEIHHELPADPNQPETLSSKNERVSNLVDKIFVDAEKDPNLLNRLSTPLI